MKKRSSHLLILSAIVLLFSMMIAIETAQREYLYSYDPWIHHFFAKYAETQEFFSRTVEVHNGIVETPYRTFLRSDVYIFSLITGLEIFQVVRFATVFLRFLFVLMVYMVANVLSDDKKIALMTSVLIFSSYYFVWRSYISFPENLVIIFFLLEIWAFEKYRKSDKVVFLYFVGLSLVGTIFIHPKSIYIAGAIIAAYLAYFIIAKDIKTIKSILILVLVSSLISFPILMETISIFIDTFVYNIGFASSQGLVSKGNPQYIPPTFLSYQRYLGEAIIIITILGLVYLIRRDIRRNLPLLLIFSFTFLLSLGTHLQIYVPTDRMQAYLFLPLIAIAALSLKHLFAEMLGSYAIMISIASLVVLSVFNVSEVRPWFAHWHGEIGITKAINELLDADNQALIFVDEASWKAFYLLEHPGNICINEDENHDFVVENSTRLADCQAPEFYLSKTEIPPDGYSFLIQENEYYLFQKNQ